MPNYKNACLGKNIQESPESLAGEFSRAGLELSPLELDRFWKLHRLLRAKNQDGDLTRIDGFYNLVHKHYLDSAMAAELIRPQGLMMDLGTGAGFPGLGLAIRRPEWRLLLAEPRGRRLAFMEEAVELLGLANVEFYPHKVGPRFDREIDDLVTRDFESVAASLDRCALILPPGGQVFLMKGPAVGEELEEARRREAWGDFDLAEDRAYTLGPGGLKRRLLTFRKKAGAPRPATTPYRVVEIASRENPRYKSWLKLLEGRGLKKSGQALVAGRKFVAEILAEAPGRAQGILARRLSDLEGLAVPENLPVHLLRPELFPALDIFAAGPPLLLVEAGPPPDWDGRLSPGLTLFLPFQDPSNLGAAIRTVTALGADIVILKEAANPWHPKSLRAAGPAILGARLFQGPELAGLAALGLPGLYALSARGENIFSFEFPAAAGLVAGIEGPGLDDAMWPKRLAIPMSPGVESLNAAAAVAVAAALASRQFFMGGGQG